MQCSAIHDTCYEHVKVVVKHTFIEFQFLGEEDAPQVRRRKSDSSVACKAPARCTMDIDKPSELPELFTPTTCASVSGDDDDQSSLASPFLHDENDIGKPENTSFSKSVADELFELPQTSLMESVNTCEMVWPQACDTHSMLSTCPPILPSSNVLPAGCRTHGSMYVAMDQHDVQPDEGSGVHTTLMVRNLQPDLCQAAFVKHFLQAGYKGLFDFVYMPMNLREHGNFGYAFINFISPIIAAQVMMQLQNHDTANSDRWTSTWSNCQGLEENVNRYRDSPLMHELIPKDCKPTLYDHSGNPVTFPKPTKTIPKPRIHRKTIKASQTDLCNADKALAGVSESWSGRPRK